MSIIRIVVHICLTIRIVVMSYLYQQIFLCVLHLCPTYINKFHTCLIIMYIIPKSMNILCAYSLELFLCHTYINEFSMCLLVRMISMSNLYQQISHMSHYHVCHFYVQPISTNSMYVSLSES